MISRRFCQEVFAHSDLENALCWRREVSSPDSYDVYAYAYARVTMMDARIAEMTVLKQALCRLRVEEYTAFDKGEL